MKTLIILLAFAFMQTNGAVQSKNIKTIEFEVLGNCNMCKNRIEKALNVDGVESAKWDSKKDMVTVSFIPEKIKEEKLHQLIAEVGHDTEKVKATDEAYAKLHGCCKYEREDSSDEKSKEYHQHKQ